MKKIYVTAQQLKTLKDAWDKTLGTSEYHKYCCASYCKLAGKKKWFLTGYTCAAFINGYFKTVRGETYIYSDVNVFGDTYRVCLTNECKKLLEVESISNFEKTTCRLLKEAHYPSYNKNVEERISDGKFYISAENEEGKKLRLRFWKERDNFSNVFIMMYDDHYGDYIASERIA